MTEGGAFTAVVGFGGPWEGEGGTKGGALASTFCSGGATGEGLGAGFLPKNSLRSLLGGFSSLDKFYFLRLGRVRLITNMYGSDGLVVCIS